jgi:hypothetical protein
MADGCVDPLFVTVLAVPWSIGPLWQKQRPAVAAKAGPMPVHECLGTDNRNRYSWMKNQRSPFVSQIRPRVYAAERSTDTGVPCSPLQAGSST